MKEEESESGLSNNVILSKQSRRSFLKKAAVGAAVVGAAVAIPAAGMSGMSLLPSDDHREVIDSMGSNRLVAYVKNPSKGEVVVMMGEREVKFQDFGLVSSLARLVMGVK